MEPVINTPAPKIIVFSTPTCPYCVMVKNYLKSKNIDFEAIDLTLQPEWIDKMQAKSGQLGVPQVWIDDKVIIGFDRLSINTALGISSF
jgi:glutaredoxin 3